MNEINSIFYGVEPFKFYYNKHGLFYEGQELENYDCDGNYLCNVRLNKFIIHYDRKTREPYICFNFGFLDKKQTYTFPCENFLGGFYRVIKNPIDKK